MHQIKAIDDSNHEIELKTVQTREEKNKIKAEKLKPENPKFLL